jgi:hypothetical protein
MRTYLLVTAIVFALLALVHIWRAIEESSSLARDPWFAIVTVISAALSIWAFRLWRRAPRAT